MKQIVILIGCLITIIFAGVANAGNASLPALYYLLLNPPSTFGTVTSAGQVWMDRNLGASRVGTSSTDADAYGDLYQWGRLTDGHEKRTSTTTTTLSDSDAPGHANFIATNAIYPNDWRSPQNDTLWQGVSGTNNPCPAGFRLPTQAEWEIERLSWSSNDPSGAYGSPLKLVLAGRRYSYTGTLTGAGTEGNYWSSTVSGSFSFTFYFSNGTVYSPPDNRAYGLSVRCIQD